MKPPRRRTPEPDRVRNLIALDAAGLVRRLAACRGEMIALFSRHRDRDALLTPLRSLGPTAAFHDLMLLEPVEQSAVAAFYEELESLRWYFRYTADMPSTAQGVFEAHWGRLSAAHEVLAALVGRGRPLAPASRKRLRRSPARRGLGERRRAGP